MAQNENTPVIEIEGEGKGGEVVVVSPGKRKLLESAISSPLKKQLKADDSNGGTGTEETKDNSAAEPGTKSVVDDVAVDKLVDVEAPSDEKAPTKDDSGEDPDIELINEGLEPKAQEVTDEATLPEANKSKATPEDAVEVPQAEVTA